MSDLQQFKDDLAKSIYGQTTEDAKATGLCIQCKQPAFENCYSEAGRREYRISGLCEKCFDSICGEED
jgi:hypothetical protein